MEIIRNRKDLNTLLRAKRREKLKIGLIPTMGSIHQGHISLVKNSKKKGLFSIVTIYINPTQFNNRTDYLNYPKSLDKDFEKLIAIDCNAVYLPQQKEIYPKIVQSKKTIKNYRNILCDKFRPGHFDGVTTVVEALFRIVNPDEAFFGEKDYQQLKIIKSLNLNLNLNIKIHSCVSIRMKNGISFSSRFNNLSPAEKKILNNFSKKIINLISKLKLNISSVNLNDFKNELAKIGITKIDYFEIRDEEKLALSKTCQQSRLFIGVFIGQIRIIDNFVLY